MQTGKVPPKILENFIFPHLGKSNTKVLIGPSVGEDGAAILNEGKYLVVSTDPITGIEKGIGKYVVHINANDIASMGAAPRYMTLNIMIPRWVSPKDLENITREVSNEAEKLDIAVVGGHTEVTDKIDKPILVGSMIGFTSRLLRAEDIRSGDKIILTKGAGIEGASILAQRYAQMLKEKALDEEVIREAQNLRKEISVLKEALLIRDLCVFLHDPTEGGVLGGLHEICDLAKKGFSVTKDEIIVPEVVQGICSFLHVDPLKLIGSGALLIVAKPEKCSEILSKLRLNGIQAKEIGDIVASVEDRNLPGVKQDELWRVRKKYG